MLTKRLLQNQSVINNKQNEQIFRAANILNWVSKKIEQLHPYRAVCLPDKVGQDKF